MTKKNNNNPFKSDSDNFEEININETFEETHELGKDEEPKVERDEWQEKYENLNQQYLRLAADFDNFRKRRDAEREELLNYGTENALKKLIDVLDNFERGQKALESVQDCEQVKESFNLIHKQTMDVLQKLGMEPIETENQEFDPNFHEAVMQTPTNDFPEHTIITEMQKGYKIGDKVLRPSLVNVATQQT